MDGTTLNASYAPRATELVCCVACQSSIDSAAAEFTAAGSYICSPCSAQNDIAETDQRAVRAITGTSIMSVLSGLCGLLLFNPFLLVSMIAVGQSLYVLRSMDHSYYRERQRHRGLVKATAIIGLILGCLPPLLVVGVMILVLTL